MVELLKKIEIAPFRTVNGVIFSKWCKDSQPCTRNQKVDGQNVCAYSQKSTHQEKDAR